MQFLNSVHNDILDVNDGTCLDLCGEATALCNDLFGEIIGEWNGSAQSPNCVSFLCNGKGPRLWLATTNVVWNTKGIIESPAREKKLYLMFVVPLTESTREEVSTLARNSTNLKALGNDGRFTPQIFGKGFVRYGKGHVFCVFAEYPESKPLQWFESPQTLGLWMERFYEHCSWENICFDRELTMEDFVVTFDGVLMARLDKYEIGETFGSKDRMRFLCVLMELLTEKKFLLYKNTTKENIKKRVRKTLKEEMKGDKGNVLPLVWRILSEI
ncbi:hypothetical protein A9K97_gp425 [Tokyovirus A1]|uniref:hypothetical protein n=1 Tax=Tokyovirus A1 TaxID=1826170 RepID=UPI0007A98887|nr:hypothetical protein A9K97_gp425 [Tokyovirus A1]BAU79926.1 hypothetical protein [Tokyovirus A1]